MVKSARAACQLQPHGELRTPLTSIRGSLGLLTGDVAERMGMALEAALPARLAELEPCTAEGAVKSAPPVRAAMPTGHGAATWPSSREEAADGLTPTAARFPPHS
jgi:hypothetical protein